MKHKIFRLRGKVQHYAWGGYEFIPHLLGFENTDHRPCAEYWIGAHPSASGKLETEEGLQSWNELIQQQPLDHLGEKVYEQFGELPYLLKVLDVREMLSIQVHPTKEEAKKGFEKGFETRTHDAQYIHSQENTPSSSGIEFISPTPLCVWRSLDVCASFSR